MSKAAYLLFCGCCIGLVFLIGIPAAFLVLIVGWFLLSFFGRRSGYVALVKVGENDNEEVPNKISAGFECISLSGFEFDSDLVALVDSAFSVNDTNSKTEQTDNASSSYAKRNFDRYMMLREFVADLMVLDSENVRLEKGGGIVRLVLPTGGLSSSEYRQLRRLYGLVDKSSFPLALSQWRKSSSERYVPLDDELDSYLFAGNLT